MAAERVKQALERLAEDETLFADLDDAGAKALRGWIERELRAAGDAADWENRSGAIRRAARTAARSGEADPVAAARTALAAAPGPQRGLPQRSSAAAYRAAAAHLLGPAGDTAASPAAALLPTATRKPAPEQLEAQATTREREASAASGHRPQATAASAEWAEPRRKARARRRRWRYRKAS